MELQTTTNRLMIYCFYDSDGIAKDYVTYFLKSFRPYCKDICVVINGFVTKESEIKLKECADKLLVRENIGYDACAYKFGIESYGYEEIKNYDELILANSTFYGPIFSPKEIFDKMNNKDADFWGITKHPSIDSYCAGVKIDEHVQSYFINFRKRIINSDDFKEYWNTLKVATNYGEAVAFHELRTTTFYESRGYKSDCYISPEKWNDKIKRVVEELDYRYFYLICQQIEEDRMPFVKRKIFIDTKRLFQNKIEKGPLYLLDYIKTNTDYDINFILSDIKRTKFYKNTNLVILKKILCSFICLIFIPWKYNHNLQKIKALFTLIVYKKRFGNK